MSAYQHFLDFFSMHNRERLDGLSEAYFAPMTPAERSKAFDYLLELTKPGGSDESVKGLFIADAQRAAPVVRELLDNGVLNDDAALAAAWALYRLQPDPALIPVFLRLMSHTDHTLRARAAFYVPADESNAELLDALRGMIRTETEKLPLVNATNKLLECYGITEDSLPEPEYLRLYRGLRSDDPKTKEATFKDLDRMFGLDA